MLHAVLPRLMQQDQFSSLVRFIAMSIQIKVNGLTFYPFKDQPIMLIDPD